MFLGTSEELAEKSMSEWPVQCPVGRWTLTQSWSTDMFELMWLGTCVCVQLAYCCVQFMEKDSTLSEPVCIPVVSYLQFAREGYRHQRATVKGATAFHSGLQSQMKNGWGQTRPWFDLVHIIALSFLTFIIIVIIIIIIDVCYLVAFCLNALLLQDCQFLFKCQTVCQKICMMRNLIDVLFVCSV